MSSLHELLENSARLYPDNGAVADPGQGAMSYRELNHRSGALRDALRRHGVCPGDRVGIYAHKSIDTVVAIFGILKAGAAYVPADPGAPPKRIAYIFDNCAVKVVVIETAFLEGLRAAFDGAALPVLEELDNGFVLIQGPGAAGAVAEPAADLAYILYTSGSTGKPKGVMLSHRAALGFIDWCSEAFRPSPSDRFSSHSPFHFDLSILDLYLPIKHGATIYLIGEELGKQPARLAPFIAENRITSWYSTPSILRMLVQFGKLERFDWSALRFAFFAGEVYPVKQLRELKTLWSQPRYFNLYGPTETNVCTYYEVPAEIPPERTEPFPIGKVCSGDRAMVVDSESALAVAPGSEGELWVTGASVMNGYWNLPEQSAKCFHRDADGVTWYKTGDLVRQEGDGNYIFIGRRDRMVKRRSYRVELGEIEAALYRHPAVVEAAAIALPDEESGVQIKAFLSCPEGGRRPSLIELKKFCLENLPHYMVPDRFSFQPALPKTSTDKIDYQRLKELD